MNIPRSIDGRIPDSILDTTIRALSKHTDLNREEAYQLLLKIEQAANEYAVRETPLPFLAAKAW